MAWNFTDWYAKNAQEHNTHRRTRYHADPEYRAKVLEANRKNREKNREKQSAEDKARKKAIKVIAQPAWKEVEGEPVEGGGSTQAFVTIGAVAHAVRRSTQSIRLWEKTGFIEETQYRNERGDRLYTPEMVKKIMDKVKEAKGLEPVDHKSEVVAVDAKITRADGVIAEARLFRVGVLAQVVGRTVLTLEQMERKGVFPATPLRDPKTGHRFYTAEMIESVKTTFDSMGGARLRGEHRKAEFNARITEEWTKQGVIGASVVSIESKGSNDGEQQAG